MAQRKTRRVYKTINVTPQVFQRVQLIAEVNDRGLGDQVAAWANSEVNLPDCGHKKQVVTVETFPGDDAAVTSQTRQAFYCPTCKRVYAKTEDPEPVGA